MEAACIRRVGAVAAGGSENLASGGSGKADACSPDRPELHEALLGGLGAVGESKRRLDTLRELSTLRPVVSIGPAGHGIAMHYHDEAWLLVLTGRKRWLLIDPHGAASQVCATLG